MFGKAVQLLPFYSIALLPGNIKIQVADDQDAANHYQDKGEAVFRLFGRYWVFVIFHSYEYLIVVKLSAALHPFGQPNRAQHFSYY